MKLSELSQLSKKKQPTKLPPIKAANTIELEYYRGLKAFANMMKKYVRENLLPDLKTLQPQYTQDSYADDLDTIFSRMRLFFMSSIPRHLAKEMVTGIDFQNRKRLSSILNAQFGVDVEGVIANEKLQPFIEAQMAKNATLIKSIPEEFIKNIETIVYNGVTSGRSYEDIAREISGVKDISSVFGKLDNRVKLIARNETSTINAQINQKRFEALGSELYIWHTAQDERVRGARGGNYPDARPRHSVMEGKVCQWNDATVYADSIKDAKAGKWKKRSSIGAPEQHPGEPIACRCFAEPIFLEE